MTMQAIPPSKREITGVEKTTLNAIIARLRNVITFAEEHGIHAEFLVGVTSSYEKMLDAMMYGYPATVFDGWNAQAPQARPVWRIGDGGQCSNCHVRVEDHFEDEGHLYCPEFALQQAYGK